VAVVIVGVSRSKRVVLRESGPQRWARWKGWLEDGTCGSRAEVARREGVSRAAVTQGLGKLEHAPVSACQRRRIFSVAGGRSSSNGPTLHSRSSSIYFGRHTIAEEAPDPTGA